MTPEGQKNMEEGKEKIVISKKGGKQQETNTENRREIIKTYDYSSGGSCSVL